MADIDSYMALDAMAELETLDLLDQRSYLVQHWGQREKGVNAGFGREVPAASLIRAVMVRLDVAKKQKTDWVALVRGTDWRVGDKLVAVHNGKKRTLEVSAVNPRGNSCELELKNG